MAIIQELLTEKLRPKTLDEVILLPRIRKALGTGESVNQHLMLHGIQGCGKCVDPSTLIEIRNDETGEIKLVKIGDLFDFMD